MQEITLHHRKTLTTREEGTKVVEFNEWIYDGLQVHVAMWFDDHMVQAKEVEISIYDEPLSMCKGQVFSGPGGRYVIHTSNGYWIDRIVRHEKQEFQGLSLVGPEPKEVNSITIKLDNQALRCLGVTRPVINPETGKELWKEAIPLLQHIEEKKECPTT